jgi:glycerol-3-phosphate dehydrogenase
MGEDCINRVAELCGLPPTPSRTAELHLHGYSQEVKDHHWTVYGTDSTKINDLAKSDARLADPLDQRLPYTKAEVVWAAREEMARTVEDVLSRRTRSLLLNSTAALEAAPVVAEILAAELGRSPEWQQEQVEQFKAVAKKYQLRPAA